jgi:toxin-antitoxin system PIN domain toxin
LYVVDANVLLYSVDEGSPHHAVAATWLKAALSGQETVGLAWVVMIAFLRVSTHALLFDRPLPIDQATDAVAGWLAWRTVAVLEPGPRHLTKVRGLLAEVGTAGNLVNDAHLAALALEHDAEVVSFDRDFERFEGLRWRLPG